MAAARSRVRASQGFAGNSEELTWSLWGALQAVLACCLAKALQATQEKPPGVVWRIWQLVHVVYQLSEYNAVAEMLHKKKKVQLKFVAFRFTVQQVALVTDRVFASA